MFEHEKIRFTSSCGSIALFQMVNVMIGNYPIPLAHELRTLLGEDFQSVALSTWTQKYPVAFGEKKFTESGNFMGPDAPEMPGLEMIQGTRSVLLLSKDFVVLVAISCVIAFPLTTYFLNNWLQRYDYRTEISWWIFPLVGSGTVLLTLLVVSYQAVKAASVNPIQSLRSE